MTTEEGIDLVGVCTSCGEYCELYRYDFCQWAELHKSHVPLYIVQLQSVLDYSQVTSLPAGVSESLVLDLGGRGLRRALPTIRCGTCKNFHDSVQWCQDRRARVSPDCPGCTEWSPMEDCGEEV